MMQECVFYALIGALRCCSVINHLAQELVIKDNIKQ